MIERVITGGQTGADQAGWWAAHHAGIATGGTMPRDFMTEDGPDPVVGRFFGATESSSPKYPPRTYANARDSDATIWFGATDSDGCRATFLACKEAGKPLFVVTPGRTTPRMAAEWLAARGVKILNVAGNRGSRDHSLGPRVQRFLAAVFKITNGGDE